MERLSITELKHLKNQAKSLTDKRIKRSLKKIRFQVSLGAEEEIHNIFYLIHKKKLNF